MNNKELQAIIKELFIRHKKIEYISCIYHTVLSFCSKRSEIKLNTLPNYEDS